MRAKTLATRPTQTQTHHLVATQMALTNAVWHSKTSGMKIKKNLPGKTNQMPPNQPKRKPTQTQNAALTFKMTDNALQTESAGGLNAKIVVVKSGES